MRATTPFLIGLSLLAFSALAETPPPPAPEALAAARLFDAGDWAGAARAYEALAKANPAVPQFQVRQAAALHSQGRYADALAVLGASKTPQNPNVVMGKARAQARLGKTEDALASLEAGTKAGFNNVQALDEEADLQPLRSDPRFKQVREAADRNNRPCAYQEESRQFDFWLGDWDVTVAGVPAGTSHVEKILNECVVFENWTGASSYIGKSFNLYDAQKKRWQQTWVDGVGGVTEFFGEWRDGALRYTALGTVPPGQKDAVDQRMTFFKLDDGRVRQYIDQSTDAGKTWTPVFDGFYSKKK
jgi:hypothetical protein